MVIGASTGGPPAIQAILKALPSTFSAAIVIAQHMPPIFTRHFAERLNYQCALGVKEAEESDVIEPGRALVIPGGFHLEFHRIGVQVQAHLCPKASTDAFAPSVDISMGSAAEIYTNTLLGILLTGMGKDGARGMQLIKQHGGQTIAESEESAVIFGMPGEAIKIGAADVVLALKSIGPALFSRSQALR